MKLSLKINATVAMPNAAAEVICRMRAKTALNRSRLPCSHNSTAAGRQEQAAGQRIGGDSFEPLAAGDNQVVGLIDDDHGDVVQEELPAPVEQLASLDRGRIPPANT
jgi:hypothetical protein